MNRFILFLTIILYFSLFYIIRNEPKTVNFSYPSILKLLNNNLMVVSKDKIYFYDLQLKTEDINKTIELNTTISSRDDNGKTALVQFPSNNDNDGYILVLVMNILYIFQSSGQYINSFNLNEKINSNNYCIIPYKVENNELHFFISYVSGTQSFIINYFIYDNDNETISNIPISFDVKTNNGNGVSNTKGVSCIFLFNEKIPQEVLTCFYSTNYNPEIQTRSFDQLNNLEEFKDYYINYTDNSIVKSLADYISATTDENKKKAIIYIEGGEAAFWMTFDFENYFSVPSELKQPISNNILGIFSFQKSYYFKETKEFIFLSGFWSVPVLVSIFDKNFNLRKLYIYKMKKVDNHHSFGLYYDGTNYIMYSDNAQTQSYINDFNDTECLTEIEIYQMTTTEISNIDTTEIAGTYIDSIITTGLIATDSSSIKTNEIEESDANSIKITELIQTDSEIIEKDNIALSNTELIGDEKSSIISTEIIISETSNIKTYDFLINSTSSEIYSNQNTENNEQNINVKNIKCKIETEESSSYDLCKECNNQLGYFQAILPDSYLQKDFIECYNNDSKPINFYFDSYEQKYKVCYETCLTCSKKGDEIEHNCITCDKKHRKRPGNDFTTNCVTLCEYSYYFTSYGQYKCSNNSHCPQEASLYINELKKCTKNCAEEDNYRFQYGGRCLESCPDGTIENYNNICIDNNVNVCSESETEIGSYEFLSTGGLDLSAKIYAEEFSYTKKHVSKFYNSLYSILLYKDSNCIDELSINMPKIDFLSCYTKILQNLNPPTNDSIIIALIGKLSKQKKFTTYYSFYHPVTGEKIDSGLICKNDEIIIKETVLIQLNNSNVDINYALFLTQQNIDIFNISDEFYTNICYNFISPNGKDIPLKDRILTYFPNITLCEDGCYSKGVNLTSMESICECIFNDIINNELIEGNIIIENAFGEITDLITSSNLLVLKCYKNVFNIENIKKGIGGFIIISILILEIIFSLIFIFYNK